MFKGCIPECSFPKTELSNPLPPVELGEPPFHFTILQKALALLKFSCNSAEMILTRYFRETIILLLLVNGFLSGAFARKSGVDTLDFGNIGFEIKHLLPDSLQRADSLACLLIEKSSGISDSVEGMGWFYRAEAAYYSGRFDQAGDYYERSNELLDSLENLEQKAIVLNNLGLTRYFKERYNEALEAFLKSAEFEKQLGNEHGFAQCLHNIALVQDKAGRFESAETYFSHAIELLYEMDSLAAAAAACNDYAIYLSGRGMNEEAIAKYSEALEIFRELDDAGAEAKVKCNIGALYLYEKDYLNSALHLEQALDFFKERDDASYLINIYSLFGDLYYEQGRTALAVVFYERADNMAKRKGWNNLRQKNLYSLFKALKAEQEYKKAMETLETYSQFKDSLIAANKGYIETTLGNELETELMEKELNLARGKIRERNMILIILGLIFILGIVAWILYGRNRRLRIEREKQLMQHGMSRMQMDPDFIFNSLSSVQSYIMGNSKEKTLDYLSDIAQLARELLEKNHKDLITIDEEVELLRNYLKVQCRRYFQTMNCNVHSEIISGSGLLLVPPLFARRLIDVIIYRSKFRERDCPRIEITYEQKGNVVEVVIVNHALVIDRDILSEELGILQERLRLLQRQYKSGSSHVELVDLFENGAFCGIRVLYQLPLIKKTNRSA